MKSLLITIPSNIEWSDYQKEIDAVKDGKQEMNFRCGILPKNISVGDRCYVCWRGNIVGWMRISSIGEKEFDCTTTGKKWYGKFISRSGEFHRIDPVPYKGFQGFRYIDDSDFEKIKESINEEMHVPDRENVTKLIDYVIEEIKFVLKEEVYRTEGRNLPDENGNILYNYPILIEKENNPCYSWLESIIFNVTICEFDYARKPFAEIINDDYSIKNKKMCNVVINIVLPISLETKRETILDLRKNVSSIKEMIRHEMEHAYKMYKQELAGSESLPKIKDYIEGIRKFMKDFPDQRNYNALVNYWYNALYLFNYQEVDAHINQFYQECQDYLDSGENFDDISRIPTYRLYADTILTLWQAAHMPKGKEIYNYQDENGNSFKKYISFLFHKETPEAFYNFAEKKAEYAMARMRAIHRYFMKIKGGNISEQKKYLKRVSDFYKKLNAYHQMNESYVVNEKYRSEDYIYHTMNCIHSIFDGSKDK